MDYDEDKVDEAVLALLYLTLHDCDQYSGTARAWKGHDWDALNRLYEKGLIGDPVSKAKSVVMDARSMDKSKAAFERLFGKPGATQSDAPDDGDA